MYTLQRYKGRSTKHTCPSCGRSNCFVYYVNENGTALAPIVGRCDHQSTCGYHYKPRDFFRDNPGATVPESWKAPAPIEPRKLWTIRKEYVHNYRGNNSTLLGFLSRTFGPDKTYRAAAKYQLGTTAGETNGAEASTIFWQIDKDGKPRTGKVMAYREDGHRVKEPGFDRVTWVHTLLKKKGLLPDAFEITQCLFGEHLLRYFPDKPVIIVESEKTAVICSIIDESRVYLATGGKYGLTSERLACLKGRRFTIIPDADAIEEWREKVEELKRFYDIRMGLPEYSEDDKANKRDIADLILASKEHDVTIEEKK